MLFSSSVNLALARAAYNVIVPARRLLGGSDLARVRRNDVEWELDLREGLDLTLYVTGYFQAHVVRAMQKLVKPGDTTLDIGANMGAITLHIARAVGPTGRVIAVEPTARPYSRLARNVALNPDLAARTKTMRAYLVSAPAEEVPAILHSSWSVGPRTGQAHPIHGGFEETTTGAAAITLDALLDAEGVQNLSFIKLDVDGAEVAVLKGGLKSIARHRPNILIEIAPFALNEAGEAGHVPLEMLEKLGYTFELLSGRPIQDVKAWTETIPHGFSVDVVARP